MLVLDRDRCKVSLAITALRRVHQNAVGDLGVRDAELERELEAEEAEFGTITGRNTRGSRSINSHSEDVLRLGQRDERVPAPRLPELGAGDLGAPFTAFAAPAEGAGAQEAAAAGRCRDVDAAPAIARACRKEEKG